MDLASENLARLRRVRADYIRNYRNRTGLASRQDARRWALFYSSLIRRVYNARPS
jgi:hypothetical protein